MSKFYSISLIKKLEKIITDYIKDNKIDIIHFLKNNDVNNINLHTELVKCIAEECKNYPLSKIINSKNKRALEISLEDSSIDYDIANLIDDYIEIFLKLGFISLDNPENSLENLKFSPNSTPTYYKYKIKHNKNNNLTGIILNDGTMYLSPYMHKDLIMFLCAYGIDLKNALRLEQMDNNREFTISSLYDYRYSLKFNINKHIQLTKEQAQTISIVYKTMNSYKRLLPIEDALILSNGLAIRELNAIGEHNIKILDEAFGVGNLKTEYIKETIREHNRFYNR